MHYNRAAPRLALGLDHFLLGLAEVLLERRVEQRHVAHLSVESEKMSD